MSCKRPVLLAIDGVSRDLIETADCGIYVEPENTDAIENGIRLAMREASQLQKMGVNGYSYAKKHFDRALKISKRKNLMALLMYAEKYARLLFNRKLHDNLLNELLAIDVQGSKTLLIDTIARKKAKELLVNSNLTISEIAYQTGFSDPSYFSKAFKSDVGSSPKYYRQKMI